LPSIMASIYSWSSLGNVIFSMVGLAIFNFLH
jgi:hypothetical protein